MKKNFSLLLILILCCSLYAKDEIKVYKQQKIECIKTAQSITIDGILDDSWKNAKVNNMYVVSTTKKPFSFGEARTMYDNENLYVFLKGKDKDITAYETKTDGSTYFDDVLEIFLRPGINCPWYYNAEINALGTAYTGKNHVGSSLGTRWGHLWNPEMDYAVYIKGTINNCDDIDEYWCLEAKIPFSCLDVLNGSVPKAGDIWTCNFAKYDYSIYLPAEIDGQELCSVCHTQNVFFHELVNYCPLIFK